MKFPLRCLALLGAGLLGLSASLTSAQAGSPAATEASPAAAPVVQQDNNTVIIPGPLRSFLRMAGISQEVTPADVLPMLARNVFLHGYEGSRETEFLILVDRYLHLARELRAVASNGQIYVANCEDANQLVGILGYKFEHGCSRKSAAMITENAERAFLTVDSGFPLTRLEESLETGVPFTYSFPSTPVPVLFSQQDWLGTVAWKPQPGDDLVDALIHNEDLSRLYSAMARIEPHTRSVLMESLGLRRLLPVADTLDFYGSQICIPGHAVIVPGGQAAVRDWGELAGVSPNRASEFVLHLLSRDRGWLAAYFDALSRISPEQQAHFAQDGRVRSLFEAYRSTGGNISAASGVFPRNADLLLLLTRIGWQPNGEPDIPGSLHVWQEAFARQARNFGVREWVRWTRSIDSPEKFLAALVASTNLVAESSPSEAYLKISAINTRRAPGNGLSEDTVRLLADRFSEYQEWYLAFSDFPQLDDAAIALFIKTADHVDQMSAPALRANALGAFQADLGIWEILARQKEIPASQLNASWHAALEPFASVDNSIQLFDAARSSLSATVSAAGGSSNPTEDEVVDLLAGPHQNTPDGERVHAELANRMHAVLDDQRLASLDTLFGLYDGLEAVAHGTATGSSLLPLAENLHDFEMPRPIFTGGERVAWSPLIYTSRHAELQVRTDLAKDLTSPRSPQQLEAARGRLTPFLRDTLVGLNYAYYEPPGAQVLHNNPLFVRSHDFSNSSVQGVQQVWGAPELIGIGATAGGGAYLMGSLVDLPYALASAEEDFIAPAQVQALIWRETVPQLMVSAIMPRWWGISKNEMHAAALYQRAGEELLKAARTDTALRAQVLDILRDRFTLERIEKIEEAYAHPGETKGLAEMLPSDTFYLASEYRQRFPAQAAQWGPASKELDDLVRSDPDDTSPQRLARDFGAPHPTLAETDSCSLLNREPFPVSGGYSSRLFGESWESSNLYWARLADERGYSPVDLNVLVPELTRHMVANIFATYVDDWPALLRAMQQTGNEFLQGKFSAQSAGAAGGLEEANGSASE